MIVLVANLGSTSFKYKLFDMDRGEAVLAQGAADRIGQGEGAWSITVGQREAAGKADLLDHAAAIDLHLTRLVELGAIESVDRVEAIGFKAVHGGPISGAVRVDDEVLATMERFIPLAPAHNPPYIAAMNSFRERLPDVEQVAAFETAFHATMPEARKVYGIPYEWHRDLGIRRYGFHGASHGYIAGRMRELDPSLRRVINLHLGGSSSTCAILDGRSVATSMGTTPQTGLFHNNRVGDFDAFAVLALLDAGLELEEIYRRLGKEGGLLGLSGVSADLRDVEQAAEQGEERAQLAIDAFVEDCRRYIGQHLVQLGGADAISFTGGIGQFGKGVRQRVCADLAWAGIELDAQKNEQATGREPQRIEAAGSRVQVWVLPTNEELIIARQTAAVLGRDGNE